MIASLYEKVKRLRHKMQTLNWTSLQWDTLCDFSENCEKAIQAHQKGLVCSSKLEFPGHTASIELAMAESYFDQNGELF
ncbi:hypothetical protein [Microbulbifer sp. 2205BS26-8]|uniref:hypothetical protein n=1 Tax=Microbulbifer sp. 2205BS26-8 TaxID=3064386 RepID=UPI00273D1880|nr:hypothetical protein [Microbulbifer sp. 2205BS26-8]MDP5211312.1 hypothetical protein [Microbulbifer sp. 2205BS26-8]